MDQEKVKRQAKQIMDEFVNALDKVGELNEGYGVEMKKDTRDSKDSVEFPEFRKRMFANAPKKNSDYLIMEKKSW